MRFVRLARKSLALLILVGGAMAASPEVLAQTAKCPDGKPADGIERAGDARHCVVIWRQEPSRPSARLLVVYLHGDNGGRIDLKNDRGTAAGLADTLKAVTISVQRPGYVSDAGKSDGFSGGAGDDDYTPANVELLADVLHKLRSLNPGKKILLVGHSGGSAMTALLASRFPGSADAYLLAGCPCDIANWRAWRNSSAGKSGTWSRSLSPLGEAAKMPPETLIGIVVGDRDENTLPRFSEAYASALQARGVKTRVTYAMGATHTSVRWSPAFLGVAQELADRLAK